MAFDDILITAPEFRRDGGWVLDTQFIPNMFMAGRNVSVSHEALGTVRVIRTGGMMGEVVGYAAALCRKYEILPRALYEAHLEEFMTGLRAIPRRKLTELVANV